ncbi:MAG: HNH endonuclease [Trueperaceae bacterium]
MSKTYISAELRKLVRERARNLCEYCLIHEDDTHFGCQVDHIISEKHSGQTEADNLAYACTFCNQHKGSDIASIVQETKALVRLFNPRSDNWREHFRLEQNHILSLTDIGKVTVQLLRFNDTDRIFERQELNAAGRYPSVEALELLN